MTKETEVYYRKYLDEQGKRMHLEAEVKSLSAEIKRLRDLFMEREAVYRAERRKLQEFTGEYPDPVSSAEFLAAWPPGRTPSVILPTMAEKYESLRAENAALRRGFKDIDALCNPFIHTDTAAIRTIIGDLLAQFPEQKPPEKLEE